MARAARRISKLVEFTQTNDQLKAQYNADSLTLLASIKAAEALLLDKSIDDTLNGARNKLKVCL